MLKRSEKNCGHLFTTNLERRGMPWLLEETANFTRTGVEIGSKMLTLEVMLVRTSQE